MVDLEKLDKMIDETLAKETTESLTKWLDEHRNPEYELQYCRNCIQMTNHLNGMCQKCKQGNE